MELSSCEQRSELLINEFSAGQHLRDKCQEHFLECCDDKPHVGFFSINVEQRKTSMFLEASRERTSMFDVIEDEFDSPIPESKVRRDFRESFLFQQIEIK
ncbi:complement C3-like, partial [Tropilaelaps mercedesae]